MGMVVNIKTHMHRFSALRPFTLIGKHITSHFFEETLVLGAEGCPQAAEPGPYQTPCHLASLLKRTDLCLGAGSMTVGLSRVEPSLLAEEGALALSQSDLDALGARSQMEL